MTDPNSKGSRSHSPRKPKTKTAGVHAIVSTIVDLFEHGDADLKKTISVTVDSWKLSAAKKPRRG